MNIEIRKARKQYICDYSKQKIKVGQLYKRVNINYVGVYHFSMRVSDVQIKRFLRDRIFQKEIERLDDEFAFYEDNNDIGF